MLIDHLSFQRLPPDSPWVAYQQFCEHFLAPLALMSRRDVRMGRMLRDQLDGIPLDLAATLLPGRTKLRLGLGAHVHLHARSQRIARGRCAQAHRGADLPVAPVGPRREPPGDRRGAALGARRAPSGPTTRTRATRATRVARPTPRRPSCATSSQPPVGGSGRDLLGPGREHGRFSAIAAAQGYRVLSFDIDPAAAERHYRALRADGRTDTTPLVMDLADPSPRASAGRVGSEPSLVDRANADVILALALVHHLAIGRNVPLAMVMDQFAALAPQAIVEWVPRGDPMVDVLLASREDVFTDYTTEGSRRRSRAAIRGPIADPHPGQPPGALPPGAPLIRRRHGQCRRSGLASSHGLARAPCR